MTVEFTQIGSFDELTQLVTRLKATDVISIDTEFARFNTYYPIVGLIQIYDGDTCYIIDPLQVTNLKPLAELLEDVSVLKVFHACSEDIEVFQHGLGVVPTPVFDTQTAAAILGTGFSLSYQKLVLEYLELEISKDETRSDWLQRPLTQSQLDYAALDVIHLLEVYHRQIALLEGRNRLPWVIEECRNIGKDLATTIPPDRYFLKVRGAGKLDRQSLGVVQALCAWRESTARELDVPRNRVVDEKSLLALANRRPTSQEECQRISELSPKQLRKYSTTIVEVIEIAMASPADVGDEFEALQKTPIDKKYLKSLRAKVDDISEQLTISPEILAKKRHLEFILRSTDKDGSLQLPEDLQGWRKHVIGDELLSVVTELAGRS